MTCHPRRPHSPSKPKSAVEIGAPVATAIGRAKVKPAGRESRGPRNEPPSDHDAGDPDARADLLENDVARDLEQDVTPKERAGGHAVPCGIEAKVFVHGQRGKADIDAIEIAEEISQDRKG